MEKSRKYLKEASVLVLLFTAFTLIRMMFELFLVPPTIDPEQTGFSSEVILITTIVLFVINLVLLIPQIFVGVRGLKIAKTPASTKGHIVWAVILLVFAALAFVSTIFDLAGSKNIIDDIIALADHALDVTVYCMYIKYARKVLQGV